MAMSPLSRVCVLLICILQLAGVSEALVPAQPSPTPPNWDVDHMGDGWSPRPTGSPFYNLAIALEQDALVGRQIANLHTCGFIDGNADDPITCEAGHGCYTFGADPGNFECRKLVGSSGSQISSSNNHVGTLRGCNSYGGSFSTWDASFALIGTISLHLWCQSDYPQCTTVYLHGPSGQSNNQIYVSYGCAQQAAVTTAFWAPTTPGGVIANPTSSSSSLPSSSSAAALHGSSSASSSSTETQATTPTRQAVSPASTSPSNKNTHHSHSDTAAIAGGVVGGVAGFALGFGAIAYFLWRRKRAAKVGEMRELEPDWHTSNEVSSMSMAGTR